MLTVHTNTPERIGGHTQPPRRIRVVEVTRSLNVGGLERVVATLASTLDPSRFDVSILCLLRKGSLARELEHRGIKIYLASGDSGRTSYLLFLKVYALFRRLKPDIVHTHNTHAFLDGVLAAKLAGVRTVVHTEHGRQFPDKLRYMAAERLLSHWVERIVAVSAFTKAQLVKHERIRPDKIEVIHNGIPFHERQHDLFAIKSGLSLSHAYPVLGCVSRLSEEKGVRFVVEAMPDILSVFPRAALLVVGDGVLRPELEQRVRELGLETSVTFVGTQSDVSKFLSVVDVFVLGSISEGLPLAVLEAMSHGKAVVATDVGGVSEVVSDATGRLVAPRVPAAIAKAVKELATDPDRLAQVGARARTIYREQFTENVMVSNYQRLFMRCLGVHEPRTTT